MQPRGHEGGVPSSARKESTGEMGRRREIRPPRGSGGAAAVVSGCWPRSGSFISACKNHEYVSFFIGHLSLNRPRGSWGGMGGGGHAGDTPRAFIRDARHCSGTNICILIVLRAAFHFPLFIRKDTLEPNSPP
ncbi:hypothetical protein GWI33_010198 [Rhynchophorus ferrugineus]|uniref:Uncharacterized protein n=1 Tax=Rhynchophorus ferrugineus TaxID=354439 RepID=A0A834MJ26_RHYFE|nr:hypothetical protein GWI33_010198 [Rhynchophorus ferrugineus]